MTTSKKDAALQSIETKVVTTHQFTAEEEALVREVIEAYRGWIALGRMGKVLVVCLAGVTAIAVGLSHVKVGLVSWLVK